jgi:ABC-2 type transport system ATP-binding protein
MDDFQARYVEVTVNPENAAAARALWPVSERQVFGRSVFLFDRGERERLAGLGEVRTPGIAEVFVAVMGNPAAQAQRATPGAFSGTSPGTVPGVGQGTGR